MSAVETARAINLALTVLASYRSIIGTDAEIQARFNAIDAGGEGITVDEVQSKLDDWQEEINRLN